jgi:hypothetical protein
LNLFSISETHTILRHFGKRLAVDQVNRTVLGFLFTILIEHFSARHQAFAEAWGRVKTPSNPGRVSVIFVGK